MGQFQDRHRLSIEQTHKVRGPRTQPERDTVAWCQDFEKSQNARGGPCLRKEVSHPGEWSKIGSPARDPVASIEWKAKLPVSEKADLLQVEESASVEGGAGGGWGTCVK